MRLPYIIPLIYCLPFFFFTHLSAQDKGLSKDIAAVVFLDSFVVSASQSGFSVADFINIVQQDESFFLAFHNLRLQEYTATNQLHFYNKKQQIKASYSNRTHQQVVNRCRTMAILEEQITGNYFKNTSQRTHRYYTARMHESVFFTKGRICEKRDKPSISEKKLTGMSRHINELKKLIFQPGKEVEVPLIGHKTAIFKQEMHSYYHFYLQIDTSYLGKECYTFTVVTKPEVRPNKTIIKYMKTWFDKDSFQVLGRNYHLKYNGLFSFDVKMKVIIQSVNNQYIPKTIAYDGEWKIPFQKKEIGTFTMEIN